MSSYSARPPRPSTNGGKRPKTVDQWCAEAEVKSSLINNSNNNLNNTPRPPSNSTSRNVMMKNHNNNTNLTTAVPGISQTGNNRSVQSLQKILEPIATISNASIYHGSTRTTLTQQALKSPRLLASVASDKHPPEELVPLHLRPFVASDAYKNIMHKFEQQRALFTSSVVCAETAFREVLDATAGEAKRGRPDPIRSAVACGLLKRLLPPPREGASAKLLHQLLGEMARAIFDVGDQDADADVAARRKAEKKISMTKNKSINNNKKRNNNLSMYPPSSSSSSSDDYDDDDPRNDKNDYLDAQDDDINTNTNSRLLQEDSFDQLMLRPLYFQQVARTRDELYLSQATVARLRNTIKKQSVILDQSIDRWQQMLVRRIFVAWRRHTINYRPSRFEGRFRLLSSAKAKQLLTNSFLGWRFVVTAASLARAVEEIRFLKLDLARTQTLAAKVEKELHSEVNQMVEVNDNLQATIAGLKEDISAISDQVEEERRRGDVAVQMGDRWRETCLKIVSSLATGRRSANNKNPMMNLVAAANNNDGAAPIDFINNTQQQQQFSLVQYPELMFLPEEVLPVSFDFDMSVLQKAVVDVKMAKELGLLSSEQHQQEQQDQQQYTTLMMTKTVSGNNNNNEINLDASMTTNLNNNNNNNNNNNTLVANREVKTKKEIAAVAARLSQLQRQVPSAVLRVPVASEFIYKQPLVLSGLEELHGLLVLPDQDEFNASNTDQEEVAILVDDNLGNITNLTPKKPRTNSNEEKEDGEEEDVISILVSQQLADKGSKINATTLVHFTHLQTSNARFNPFKQLLRKIQKRVRQNQQAFAASFSGGMFSSFMLGNNNTNNNINASSFIFNNNNNNNNNATSSSIAATPTSAASPTLPLLSNFMEQARTSQNQAVQALIMRNLGETEPQTLLLAWVNSMCQQSPLVKRMLDTKHYHFEKYQAKHHRNNSKTSGHKRTNSSNNDGNDDHSHNNNNNNNQPSGTTFILLSGGGAHSTGNNNTTSSGAPGNTTSSSKNSGKLTAKTKKAIQNEMTRVTTRCSLGDPAILNQIIGTSPCLPTIDLPARNFGVNFCSGDVLLYLAQAMGCITLQDLRTRYNIKELQSKEQQEKERIEIEKTLAMTGGGGMKRGTSTRNNNNNNHGTSNKAISTIMAVGSCHPIIGRILRARVIDVAASSGISNLAMAEHELLLDALFAIIVLSDPWDKLDLALRSLHDVFVGPHQTELFLQIHRNKILEGLAPTELRQFLCRLLASYSDFGVNPNIGMNEILMSVLGNNNNNQQQKHSSNNEGGDKNKTQVNDNNSLSGNSQDENNNIDDEDGNSSTTSSTIQDTTDNGNPDTAAAAAAFLLNSATENKRKPLALLTAPFLALAKEQRNFQEQSWLCRVSNAVSHEAISPHTIFPLTLADSTPEIEELLMKCVASRVSRCQEWRDKWRHISSLVSEKFRKEDEESPVIASNDSNNTKTSASSFTSNGVLISAETQRELNALSLTHDQSLEAVLKKFEITYNLTYDNSTGRQLLMERSVALGGNAGINNMDASMMMRGASSSFLSGTTNNLNTSQQQQQQQQNSSSLLFGASTRGTKGKSIMVIPGSPSSPNINNNGKDFMNSSLTVPSKATHEQGTIAISTEEIIKQNKSKIRKLEWPTYQILYPTIQRIFHFNHNHNNINNSTTTTANGVENTNTNNNPNSPLIAAIFSYDRKIRSVFHSFATRSVASSVSGSSVSVGVHFGMSHASFREFIVTNGFHTKPTNAGLSKRSLGALYDLLIATRVSAREKNQRDNPINVFGKSTSMNNAAASFRMPNNNNNTSGSKSGRKMEVSFHPGENDDSGSPLTRRRSQIPTIGLNLPRDDLDLPPGQLSLGDFSAILAFVACSLAFADSKRTFDMTLCLNHLRAVVENLKPRPSSRRNERDVFQQSIDAFDVQAVFETHNNALRRAFIKAAAADGDPEMSLDEFMFVMRTTRLQVVVGADALRDIFARFAGGAEGSLLYRDFLDCLCVIAMYCDPSPFVPLSEKVSKLIKGPIAERSLPGLLSSMGVGIKN